MTEMGTQTAGTCDSTGGGQWAGVAAALLGLVLLVAGAPAWADEVDLRWRVSCGVDEGAIRSVNGRWIFAPSTNHCGSNGTFLQRSELRADDIPATGIARYRITTRVSLTSTATEPFDLFQVHDGIGGCAPPLKLRWTGAGQLAFDGAYSGASGCLRNDALRAARYVGPVLRRDGTAYDIALDIALDGTGGFDVAVELDGTTVLSGRYDAPTDDSIARAPIFFFKHGVYARHPFAFDLVSQGLTVTRD